MALRSIKSDLVLYRPSLGRLEDETRGKRRGELNPAWAKWYSTQRWKKLREVILLRHRYTCTMCGEIDPRPGHMVVDHIRAHRGDERLFWDTGNLQALCKPCHDGPKAKADRTMTRQWR